MKTWRWDDGGASNEDGNGADGLKEPPTFQKTIHCEGISNDISRSKRKSQKRSRTSSPVVSSTTTMILLRQRESRCICFTKPSSSSRQSEGSKLDAAIRDILIRYGKPIDLKTIMKELKKAGLRPSKKRSPKSSKVLLRRSVSLCLVLRIWKRWVNLIIIVEASSTNLSFFNS